MASAVLASRNEPGWGESREAKVYMRKTPNSNPNPKHAASPNPNLVAGDHGADRNRGIHDETPASTAAAVSDDSSSFVRKPPVESGGFVSFNISSYSKKELRDRLVAELEQVRSLAGRIEAREIQSSARSIGYSTSDVHAGGREVTSSAGGIPRIFHQPTKYFSGKPVISPRGAKRAAPESEKALAGMMSKCRQILTKLMKVKGVSSWFNSPVDVVSMGLHDYHTIIKHPMDLGTVRSKLTKGMYNSPLSFAADVRLTFNNALLYNPEGHEVNRVAGQLLKTFEAEFCPAIQRFEEKLSDIAREEEAQQMSAWSRIPHIPESLVRAEPMMRAEPVLSSSPPPLPAPIPALVAPIAHTNEHHHQYLQQHNVVRPMMKLAKPKAKDLNKRPMTLEEKERLSEGLQTLPEEKMAQVIQIVRRRNADPVQEGDEIELDLEALDTETLWELDRFLGNCRKLISKIKRQEVMASVNPPTSSAPPPAQTQSEAGDKSPSSKRMKKSDPCDEDVDIGDEMPTTIYPSVVIEKDKDAGHASSSGSSGSDSSSSSSDSDSDSSSDSDSDREEEEVASLAPGLRPPSPKD